ncbi:MAG: 50S ribosomal protein L32 [Clostridia bacterium]
MAVPKTKVSKAKRNSRNSANFNVATPTLVECPQCHEKKRPHMVCPKCGFYAGKQIVVTEKKEKKGE